MTLLPPDLHAQLLKFRTDRDWDQFHNPRALSAALSVEAAELLEHFIWAKDGDLQDIVQARRAEIEFELADVAILLEYLCHDLEVDLAAVVARKLELNAQKYPVEKARGRSEKYTRL